MLDPKTAHTYNIILSIAAGILFVLIVNYFMKPSNMIVIETNTQYKPRCSNKDCFDIKLEQSSDVTVTNQTSQTTQLS